MAGGVCEAYRWRERVVWWCSAALMGDVDGKLGRLTFKPRARSRCELHHRWSRLHECGTTRPWDCNRFACILAVLFLDTHIRQTALPTHKNIHRSEPLAAHQPTATRAAIPCSAPATRALPTISVTLGHRRTRLAQTHRTGPATACTCCRGSRARCSDCNPYPNYGGALAGRQRRCK